VLKIVIIVIFAEIFTAIGQVLFKKSTNELEAHDLKKGHGRSGFVREVASKPSIWIGMLSMAAGLVIWLIALAQGDLSIVFSIGSIQYLMILYAAHVFLGEKIDRMKLIGTLLVVVGVVLITLS
jgi:drug/metabolite transporter (DMT)-like permease